jgi:antitoxin Phd
MRSWPVQDAKARFGEMLEACIKHGPQVVTMRGTEAAVLVPIEEWRRVHGAPTRTLKELLLTDDARGNIPISGRGLAPRQPVRRFE